jgi:hypothetical protein
MTQPIHSQTIDGVRYYTSPSTNEKFVSVTSVLSTLDKPALRYWVGKQVATYAVEERATWLPIAEKDPKGALDLIKGSPWRTTESSANLGSAVHEAVEKRILGENLDINSLTDQVKPFIKSYLNFEEIFKPQWEMSEATVISYKYGYAGTIDAVANFNNPELGLVGRYLIDWKTSASGPYPEAALQLSAYKHADKVLLPNGVETELPECDGAIVVKLRPRSYEVVPCEVGKDTFKYFRHLQMAFKWQHEKSKEVLSAPIRPVIGGNDESNN